jgi:pantothenate kinase-related protein Tda10
MKTTKHHKQNPLVIGISGPNGVGKDTVIKVGKSSNISRF